MHLIRHTLTVASMLLFLTPALQTQAQGSATTFVKQKHSQLKQLLKKPNSKGAQERIQKLLDALIDYRELSKLALSKHWQTRSTSEQDAFVELLKELVQRNYRGNIKSTDQYKVAYLNESKRKGATVVRTEARSTKNRRAPAVLIDYSLQSKNNVWVVFDITTDAVSMVTNYRRQFNKIIKKDGWNGLMERMRKKVAAATSTSTS